MRFLALPAFEPGWVWLVGAGPGEPFVFGRGGEEAPAIEARPDVG